MLRNKFVAVLCLILVGRLFAQENEEFRSTWIVDTQWLSPNNTAEENRALTREILDNHSRANMTSVIWQIRRFGTVYYPSQIEPWGPQSGFVDPGYDPVQYAIEQAHERGLEFHAWFNVFESRFQYPGSPSQGNPDWICRDRDGIIMPREIAWLSPGLAEVRNHLLSVAMEIVTGYDIDGLHLDFVRWNEHTNSGLAVNLAKENLQTDLPDGIISEAQLRELTANAAGRFLYDVEHPFSAGVPDGFATWEDWWRNGVTQFVRTLQDSIKAVKPWVRLSPAALGRYNWGGWQGFNVVYQDAALWFNEGYIDQLVGMHYHWSLPQEFTSILASGCPNCWSQFIQKGINAGRLYSVGLFSDSFSERNIFGRHPSIINTVRTIPWADGFQFFSYGSWRDNEYWRAAAEQFYLKKAKIRASGLIDDQPPNAPSLVLTRLDSLRYQIAVTPADAVPDKQWFAVYRSVDAQLDRRSDEIINLGFGDQLHTYTDSISGNQDFNGNYTYFATRLDRFWNESDISNAATTDPIPSFAPQIIASSPAQGDTIPVTNDISLSFSKTMDVNSSTGSISLLPAVAIGELDWSQNAKRLTIRFAEPLNFETDYTLTVSSGLLDVNGVALDGNADGTGGDPFTLAFRSLSQDVFGPKVLLSYPDFNMAERLPIDGVITFVFDETVDRNSVSESNILFQQAGTDIPFGFQITDVGEQSVLGIQALGILDLDREYTISLLPEISDTLGNQIGGMVSLTVRSAEERYAEVIVIDQFLSTSNWFQPNGSGSTVGIVVPRTSFAVSTEAYMPSAIPRQRTAPALTYEWDDSASEFLIREFLSGGPPRAVEFDTSYTMQCFIFGDGSNNKFRFAVDDNLPAAAAGNHEVSEWVTVNWKGWRLVEWKLGDPNGVGIWIGDGVLDGQLRFDSFQLTHEPGDAKHGKLFFDNLRLVKKTDVPVSVMADESPLPETFRLHQNYPNPFNPSTTISFDLPRAATIELKLFDILGRELGTLANGPKPVGSFKVMFDAAGLPSGTYIYRLSVEGGTVLSRKMLYLK